MGEACANVVAEGCHDASLFLGQMQNVIIGFIF